MGRERKEKIITEQICERFSRYTFQFLIKLVLSWAFCIACMHGFLHFHLEQRRYMVNRKDHQFSKAQIKVTNSLGCQNPKRKEAEPKYYIFQAAQSQCNRQHL
jgi:hypothetical protein